MSLNEITSFFGSLYGIFLIVIFFGGSIFVHELGHFLAARKRGLKIERFSIGFGPRLFGWTGKDGVDYRVSLLPLGGYVALPQMVDMEGIEGKNESDPEKLPPISYADKMIVAVAGVVFNIIFAFLLACVLWWAKMPASESIVTRQIGHVVPYSDNVAKTPSPAAAAGLRAGDTILAVDGHLVEDFADAVTRIQYGDAVDAAGKPSITLKIKRGDAVLDIVAAPEEIAPLPGDKIRQRKIGIEPAAAVIAGPEKNSPAEKAGLRLGDKILTANGEPVYSQAQMVEIFKAGGKNDIVLTVQNTEPNAADTSVRTVTITPEIKQRTVETARITFSEDGTTRALNVVSVPDDIETKDQNAERRNLMIYDFLPSESKLIDKLTAGTVIESVNLPDAIVNVHTLQELADNSEKLTGKTAEIFCKTDSAGEKIALTDLKVEIVPAEFAPQVGIMNIAKIELVRKNPVEQLQKVFSDTFSTLEKLVNPKSSIGVNHLMGVVGMAKVYYTAADDLRRVIWFTIVININLAILNILPIPVLDGGHMLIATIQRIAGRPVPLKILVTLQYIFVGLLFAFMGYVILNDVKRLGSNRKLELQYEIVSRYVIKTRPAETPAADKTPAPDTSKK